MVGQGGLRGESGVQPPQSTGGLGAAPGVDGVISGEDAELFAGPGAAAAEIELAGVWHFEIAKRGDDRGGNRARARGAGKSQDVCVLVGVELAVGADRRSHSERAGNAGGHESASEVHITVEDAKFALGRTVGMLEMGGDHAEEAAGGVENGSGLDRGETFGGEKRRQGGEIPVLVNVFDDEAGAVIEGGGANATGTFAHFAEMVEKFGLKADVSGDAQAVLLLVIELKIAFGGAEEVDGTSKNFVDGQRHQHLLGCECHESELNSIDGSERPLLYGKGCSYAEVSWSEPAATERFAVRGRAHFESTQRPTIFWRASG